MPRLPARFAWNAVVLEVRERRHETQADLARSLGCSVFSVSKWECGAAVPTARHRRQLERLAIEVGYPSSDWPDASTGAGGSSSEAI